MTFAHLYFLRKLSHGSESLWSSLPMFVYVCVCLQVPMFALFLWHKSCILILGQGFTNYTEGYVWGCAELGPWIWSLDHLSLWSFSNVGFLSQRRHAPTNCPSLNNQAIKVSIHWYRQLLASTPPAPHHWLEAAWRNPGRTCQILPRSCKDSANAKTLCNKGTSSLTGSGASRTTPTTLFAWRSLREVLEKSS